MTLLAVLQIRCSVRFRVESRVYVVGEHDVDSLNEGIDAVQNRIRATYASDHSDDDASFDEMSAREAGYLVGVQVGLRLRGVSNG